MRRYAYARTLGGGVYTPEVVVNGRAAGVGAAVSIGPGAGKGEVWLALYEPHPADVVIARGENAGRTLRHRNIVRRLIRVDEWSGAATRLMLPDAGGLSRAVWLQERDAGPILAAARG